MRVLKNPPSGFSMAETPSFLSSGASEERMAWYVKYAIRLTIGLLLGAVLGPYLQQGIALTSLRVLFLVSLMVLVSSLGVAALCRTTLELCRNRRWLW